MFDPLTARRAVLTWILGAELQNQLQNEVRNSHAGKTVLYCNVLNQKWASSLIPQTKGVRSSAAQGLGSKDLQYQIRREALGPPDNAE